ncbi:MAG: alkaline phosphatase D family protein [Gemmatimonadetes bacterium]|nr:alkaline phosphatase D family protein [Gemmatimonadota bacterium]
MIRRRDFLTDLTRYAALAAGAPAMWHIVRRLPGAGDPFTLGVASGDPSPTGVVLWTRLAPQPLEPLGGLGSTRVEVRWEVAEDERFSRLVHKGTATAIPELSHAVHVEVNGLHPGRWYHYRFLTADGASPVGRTRTAPRPTEDAPLAFAVASCQHYEYGHYTAYEHMANEELDLVLFLGDYIYEQGAIPTRVRMHAGPECVTLEHYRQRYAQYKTDANLQRAHARFPWLTTWDDHEVSNNYAQDIGQFDRGPTPATAARRTAGYQAWWEHAPVRIPRAANWHDLRVYQRMAWGRMADLHLLDCRQYRTDQACGDGNKPVPCGDWSDPARTMLGAEQEQWLIDGLKNGKGRWQLIGNPVMLAAPDIAPKEGTVVYMDAWSGYPAARDRLLRAIADHAPNRTAVVTGDIHANYIWELKTGFDRPERAVVAAEFVGTSITSDGDGSDVSKYYYPNKLAAPDSLKWHSARRGYLSCKADATSLTCDVRSLAFVSRPGAPLTTASRWKLTHGKPGLEAVGA